jgi:hypothetical protein
MVLRKIFGPKRDEVNRGVAKITFMVSTPHQLYYLGD